MTAIGGYFELELQKAEEYHNNAIRLNTGRNALEYILLANKYRKIYIPYFTCDVLLQPIKRNNIEYEFYNIDINFEPIFDFLKILDDECFLYTNYFGLKDPFIETLTYFCKNLIIDNAQAFFSKPISSINTFYSPRKFVGVSDGAYLFCSKILLDNFEQDFSFKRMSHLLIRTDINAEEGYSDFKNNENNLDNLPIKKMSQITKNILASIDYKNVANIRRGNFEFINNYLGISNFFKWQLSENAVPLVYPYWTENIRLKNLLIQNKVYSAQYWPNVLDCCDSNSFEYKFTKDVIFIPIDQRYSVLDMEFIVKIIING